MSGDRRHAGRAGADRRYAGWAGLAALALVGTAALAPGHLRREVVFGVALAALLQGPLGWWTLRSIGTDRFAAVWGMGMVVRLAVVALTALGVLPVLGWARAPALLALVGGLVALLGVEAASAARRSGEIGRP